MNRVGRNIFNGLTLLSLLLAILMAAAWGRSYWRWEQIAVEACDSQSLVVASLPKGNLGLVRFHADRPGFAILIFEPRGYYSKHAEDVPPIQHTFLGIGWERGQNRDWGTSNRIRIALTTTVVQIPDAHLLAPLPAIRLYRRSRRCRLVLVGCCANCGYDLRASPDRRPECGRAAKVMI